MAEHERESSDHSPHGPDHRRTHPGSPGLSECSSGYTGPVSENEFSTSGNSEHLENGYTNGHHAQDGDSNDAPLDFSVKKTRSDESTNGDAVTRARVEEEVREHIQRAFVSEVGGHNGGTHSPHNGRPHTPEARPRLVVNGDRVKVGEPKPAPAGAVPGAIFPGMFPGLPAGVMPTPAMMNMAGLPLLPPGINPRPANANSIKNGTRPFKAYPKDALSQPVGYYNFSGMLPFPSLDAVSAQSMGLSPEEMFAQYRDYILKLQEHMGKENHKNGKMHLPANGEASSPRLPDSTDTCSNASSEATSPSTSVIDASNFTGPLPPIAASASNGSSNNRKRPKVLPEDMKDQSYWDRRRKNNAAAKRSRDSRRAKEDEIAIRAAFLEQENLKLRVEVAALKNETSKLRCMLYNS